MGSGSIRPVQRLASGQKWHPLALLDEFKDNPNAMFVLWKDHTAVAGPTGSTVWPKAGAVPITPSTRVASTLRNGWAKILHI